MSSSAASGQMDQYDEKNNATWIKRVAYTSRPRWQELYNLGMRCFLWLQQDPERKMNSVTDNGNCLVAVACYDQLNAGDTSRTWWVFCGTIPRGSLRRHMDETAPHAGRHWFNAVSGGGGVEGHLRTLKLHAEDTVLARMNEELRTLTVKPGAERIRILVVGSFDGGPAGMAYLCTKPRDKKYPPCQKVAKALAAKYIPTNASAAWMDDYDDEDYRRKLAQQRQMQQQQQLSKAPKNAGPSQPSVAAGSGGSKPKPGSSSTGSAQGGKSAQELALAMSTLSLGGSSKPAKSTEAQKPANMKLPSKNPKKK